MGLIDNDALVSALDLVPDLLARDRLAATDKLEIPALGADTGIGDDKYVPAEAQCQSVSVTSGPG